MQQILHGGDGIFCDSVFRFGSVQNITNVSTNATVRQFRAEDFVPVCVDTCLHDCRGLCPQSCDAACTAAYANQTAEVASLLVRKSPAA